MAPIISPEPFDSAPIKVATTDENKSPFYTEDEIKLEFKEIDPIEKLDLSTLESSSPDGGQYGEPVQVEVSDDETKSRDVSPDRGSASPDTGVIFDEESKEVTDEKYPDEGLYDTKAEVGIEILEENVAKSEVEQEQSVNLRKLLENYQMEKPESDPQLDDRNSPEQSGSDGETAKDSLGETDSPNQSSRPKVSGCGHIPLTDEVSAPLTPT